jgi:DNA-binding NarL/FixJ family response regulator
MMDAGRADTEARAIDHVPMVAAAPTGQVIFLDRFERAAQTTHGTASESVRVLVADGHALMRAGVRLLLDGSRHITVIGDAADGEDAVALAARLRPDVVLIDADLPGLGCVEATRRIRMQSPAQVMVLTGSEGDERLRATLRAGASGLFLKDTEPAELARAVRRLARGEALLSPVFTRWLIDELIAQPEGALQLHPTA